VCPRTQQRNMVALLLFRHHSPTHTVVPAFALHENTCMYEQIQPASPTSLSEREGEREREREQRSAGLSSRSPLHTQYYERLVSSSTLSNR
jgi:hypothetical protein